MKKIIAITIMITLLSLNIVTAAKIKYRLPVICSDSMLPSISCKNAIYGNTVDKKTELNINDIICFNADYRRFRGYGYRYVCHRIININNGSYLTKGDNNLFEDYYIDRNDIAWKVVDII